MRDKTVSSDVLTYIVIALLIVNIALATSAIDLVRAKEQNTERTSIAIQSPCTYTWWHPTPRFKVLPEFKHGIF